ncbi:MAG: thymidylate kinase, partial [Eubacteriales bacterium]
LLLDMPEPLSEAMVQRRSGETGAALDIHEKDTGYLNRCRAAAHYAAQKCGWTVIRCAEEGMREPFPRDEIAARIRTAVADLL